MLRPTDASPGPLSAAAGRSAPWDVASALGWAAGFVGAEVTPGAGSTLDLWDALATLAAQDVALARAVEPQWDALAILHQAGAPASGGTWGVFAAEGGDHPLTAASDGDRWMLSGVKPWCSLAGSLDRALVTAHVGDGRRLFAVDLHDPGVTVEPSAWVARGLTEIPSGPVRFAAVPAIPVGPTGWYLRRRGFELGGIGVAACWWGGAVGIAQHVHAAAATKPNPHLLAHLGRIDRLLHDGRRALVEAAALADADPDVGDGTRAGGERALALRVRGTVAAACEEVIVRAGHALGPAPLALDEDYAKRVADLQLYVRQHHAERDDADLGELLAAEPASW